MLPLLFPVVPAMDDERWRVERLPALVTVANGIRVNEDQLAKVRRARLVLELAGAVAVITATGRATER